MEVTIHAENSEAGLGYLEIHNNGYSSWDSFLSDALATMEPMCKHFKVSQDKVWCYMIVTYSNEKKIYNRINVGRFSAFKFSLKHCILSNCEDIRLMKSLSLVIGNIRWGPLCETPCRYCHPE